ncbi:hypothetical protein [Nostoc sp. DSM 114159]
MNGSETQHEHGAVGWVSFLNPTYRYYKCLTEPDMKSDRFWREVSDALDLLNG